MIGRAVPRLMRGSTLRRRVPARARTPVAVLALAAAAFALVGRGLVNYDTLYALVWGRDLVKGRGPELELPLAPTPHPLANLVGAVLTPLDGAAAQDATLVLAFLFLGVLGLVVYRLGAHWFGPAAGVVAVAILLTRRPVLDFGARAYLDVPYLALLLGAVLVEVRAPGQRPKRVLVLLGLAGLLRPEAWLFAGAYVLWRREWRLLWLAAAAPVVWALHDLALTGNPAWSLTGTQDNAATLQRVTGLDDVPTTVPRRVGEILRADVLLAAVAGLALTWRLKREAAVQALVVAGVALAAFCVLAAAGLPILGRYLLLPATVGALLAGAALTHWHGRWRVAAVALAALVVVLAPAQADRIGALRSALERQDQIQDDLVAIAPRAACRPIAVPNFRPVPLLALALDEEPTALTTGQDAPVVLTPRTPQVAEDYVLDRRDLRQAVPPPPARSDRRLTNRSWRLDMTCE